MSTKANIYCLDANVLIQAWQKYYSPKFCPEYWNILNDLGKQNRIFLPEVVKEEITRTEDELSIWLKKSSIPIQKIDEEIIKNWQKIIEVNPLHKLLVDNVKGRSLADPWVISHAMKMNATVVTKENKETAYNSKRIKIPNVCENIGLRWINDFEFIQEVNIKFSCHLS
ncbi:MAG: DUF4411 family protein [Bacteroidales bacterium]|jgi:rRNA-processing protein FCF1|nr:DUF4411 family protein [Bacteroidales bacterium]